jgi:hypothetical protein
MAPIAKMVPAKAATKRIIMIHLFIVHLPTSYYADPVIKEFPRMSGGSPLHP